MGKQIEERFHIPYIKLKFQIVFLEDALLPREKVSALRGGMGEMLLRQNCIAERNCGECAFAEACVFRSTFYTRMKRKPDFMQGDDSIGYLLECEDRRTEFRAGEGFFFYFILFGNNLVYFGQYLQAFYQLGMHGLGKHHARYRIVEITNGSGQALLKGNTVHMENYHIETVGDYVERRLQSLTIKGCRNMVEFHTPLCLKFRGDYLTKFCSEAIFQAVFRRLMMMDYFVEKYIERPELEAYPPIFTQQAKVRTVPRYSSTQGTKIWMRGITGTIQFAQISQELLPYLLAGELLHIGKNSSFGFGRYTLS